MCQEILKLYHVIQISTMSGAGLLNTKPNFIEKDRLKEKFTASYKRSIRFKNIVLELELLGH